MVTWCKITAWSEGVPTWHTIVAAGSKLMHVFRYVYTKVFNIPRLLSVTCYAIHSQGWDNAVCLWVELCLESWFESIFLFNTQSLCEQTYLYLHAYKISNKIQLDYNILSIDLVRRWRRRVLSYIFLGIYCISNGIFFYLSSVIFFAFYVIHFKQR